MEYEREDAMERAPLERIKDFDEFKKHLSLERQRKQGARCMDCGVPFCQSAVTLGGMTSGCPLKNLVPEMNDMVYIGNWEQAYKRLSKTHCLPEFTARVCPALCEEACTCNLNTDAVATKANEYAIIEYAFEHGLVKADPPKVRTGKKVAVIGSGPAGLAAALKLNRRGHSVTVFERADSPGGLLRYGIPNMKLDKKIIDRRIALLKREGIEFQTGIDVGRDVRAEQLLEQYDRILLACGASQPRDIQAPGRDAEGIHFAVDYLSQVTKSLVSSGLSDKNYPDVKGKAVVVIGGGDTGNDCVGTSIRLGARSVIQLEIMPEPPKTRMQDNPWPQWPKTCKTDYGQQEAIALYGRDPREYCTTVRKFVKDKSGKLVKLDLVSVRFEKDVKSGRVQPVHVEGSERQIDADFVFIAAGFLGAQPYVAEEFGIELDARTNVRTEQGRFETSRERVFAAGDMRRGQSLVVWAVREGTDAARAIDESLMGYSNLR